MKAEYIIVFSVSFITLIVYMTFLTITLCKIKMQVYMRMFLVYIAYTVCFFARCIMDSVRLYEHLETDNKERSEEVKNLMIFLKIANSLANRAKWLILYIFIMQIQDVRIRL